MLGPVIISYYILRETWRSGYRVAGSLLLVFMVVLLATVLLWRTVGPIFPKHKDRTEGAPVHVKSISELLRIPGTKIILATMFFVSSCEMTIIFWLTSFLTEEKGLSAGVAAGMMTYFYVGQLIGRFSSGFISFKVRDRSYIRVMMLLVLVGSILLLFSGTAMLPPLVLFLGIATGPLFPLLVHESPSIVGKENAQGVIGIQIAAANFGTASVPLIVGIVAGRAGFWVFGIFLLVLIAMALLLKLFVQDRKWR
jgi:predicted MFS family arabinose efflux permease